MKGHTDRRGEYLEAVKVEGVVLGSNVKVQPLLNVSIQAVGVRIHPSHTNVLPASAFHVSDSPSRVARAQSGHSSATDRCSGLTASASKVWPSPASSMFMVDGMRTALAASAKFANTPSLLGDIVGIVWEQNQVLRE